MRTLSVFALSTFLLASQVFGQDPQPADNAGLIILEDIPIVEPDETKPVETEDTQEEVAPGTESPVFDPGDTLTLFTAAPEFTFPSVAKLVHGRFQSAESNQAWQGQPGCTASLIHAQVLLTAQHCIINKRGQMIGRVSVRFRKTGSAPIHTQVVSLSPANVALRRDGFEMRPEGGIRWIGENDLALIRLNEPVPDAATRVARIATQGDLGTFTMLTFVGYGMQLVELPGEAAGRRVLGFLTDEDVPMKITGGSLSSRLFRVQGTFVINGQPMAAGVCNGDSGGPVLLVQPFAPEKMVIVGVNHAVTTGNTAQACAQPGNESFLVGLIGNRNFIDAGMDKLLP